jgi:histidinol dehydrogenase
MLPITDWHSLSAEERRALLRRPAQNTQSDTLATVQTLIARVRTEGDVALLALTRELDKVTLDTLAVSAAEFAAAEDALSEIQKQALERAIENVRCFHAAQALQPLQIETMPGVLCERRVVPIRAVGLYVPAGSAPLPSTAVMLAVPALLAGCPVKVLCTPPRRDGLADPAVLYVAQRCGIKQVFKIGGAQAVAAMAYGTASVPKVDKIYGPGNAWVTAAKQLVAADADGAACDMPAGPSEVLVIADDSANASFVAADLLAQAEHSPDAQAVLITPSRTLAQAVREAVEQQCTRLTRSAIARAALTASRIIYVDSLDIALAISNDYAPEHLLLQVLEPRRWLEQVTSAGSVFLGTWSPEPMGDYCSGTNHVLPTYGHARAYSGLSLIDFTKRITVQELTPAGLQALGPVAYTLAQMEGLDAHANAVKLRLDDLATKASFTGKRS